MKFNINFIFCQFLIKAKGMAKKDNSGFVVKNNIPILQVA